MTKSSITPTVLDEIKRVGEIAEKIAKARNVAAPRTNPYPNTYEFKPAVGDDGVYLYNIEEGSYGERWDIDVIFVSWADIGDADNVLAGLERQIASEKRKQAMELKAHRREAYEKMKAEFENG